MTMMELKDVGTIKADQEMETCHMGRIIQQQQLHSNYLCATSVCIVNSLAFIFNYKLSGCPVFYSRISVCKCMDDDG